MTLILVPNVIDSYHNVINFIAKHEKEWNTTPKGNKWEILFCLGYICNISSSFKQVNYDSHNGKFHTVSK